MSDCDVPLVTGMVSPWLNASGLRGYHSSSEEVTQSPHRPWLGALGTAYVPALRMLAQVLAHWGMLLEVRALGGLAQQLGDTLFGPGILTPHCSLSCLPYLPVHLHSHCDKHTHPSPWGKGKKPFIKYTWYLYTYGHVFHYFIYHRNLGTRGVNSYPFPTVTHGKSQRKLYNKISLSPNTQHQTYRISNTYFFILSLLQWVSVGGDL